MSVALTRLEVPDYDLGLRGKLVRTDKFGPDSAPAFCTIIHGLSVADEVTDTPASNAANGYPDRRVAVDEDTRVDLPWLGDGVSAVIGDLVEDDGQPVPASARGQVLRLRARYAELGFEPVLGFEYEFWLLEPGSGAPLGATENAYSLGRMRGVHALAAEFIDRMERVGAPVEAFHSELGPGFFEFALKPQPALKAADGAARARQYLRDLAGERGLRASFMAKPYADKSGAGGHVHSSLVRDGVNVFADRPERLSSDGSAYLAGLVETMGDFTAMFNPFINSYKRLSKEMYVAETATWGGDDRSVALRTILRTTSAARVEHRRPGADASPYLVAAALLAGGLAGLEQRPELRLPGHDGEQALPGDLGTAVERFEDSSSAAAAFGKEFVTCYAATRRTELSRLEEWLRGTITDWELRRYGEHL